MFPNWAFYFKLNFLFIRVNFLKNKKQKKLREINFKLTILFKMGEFQYLFEQLSLYNTTND